MKKFIAYFLATVLSTLASAALGLEDRPMASIVHHASENSSIQYDCKLMGDELHCDMTQSFLRQQVTKDKFEERSREIYDSILQEKLKPGECDELVKTQRAMLDVIKNPSKLAPDKQKELQNWPEGKLNELKITFMAMENVCRKKTVENMKVLRDLLLKNEQSSCRIGSHTWKEVFLKAPPNYSNPENLAVWISKSKPTGECGVVLLNRFEQISVGDTKLKFWNYVSRKAVTNPNGTLLLGGQCKNLDEESSIYKWNSREIFVNCKTVKFSPF
jgi:hypothetical protein